MSVILTRPTNKGSKEKSKDGLATIGNSHPNYYSNGPLSQQQNQYNVALLSGNLPFYGHRTYLVQILILHINVFSALISNAVKETVVCCSRSSDNRGQYEKIQRFECGDVCTHQNKSTFFSKTWSNDLNSSG